MTKTTLIAAVLILAWASTPVTFAQAVSATLRLAGDGEAFDRRYQCISFHLLKTVLHWRP